MAQRRAASAFAAAAALAAAAPVPAQAGMAWIEVCTAAGAQLRLLPAPELPRRDDDGAAGCHAPCTLPRRPGLGQGR